MIELVVPTLGETAQGAKNSHDDGEVLVQPRSNEIDGFSNKWVAKVTKKESSNIFDSSFLLLRPLIPLFVALIFAATHLVALGTYVSEEECATTAGLASPLNSYPLAMAAVLVVASCVTVSAGSGYLDQVRKEYSGMYNLLQLGIPIACVTFIVASCFSPTKMPNCPPFSPLPSPDTGSCTEPINVTDTPYGDIISLCSELHPNHRMDASKYYFFDNRMLLQYDVQRFTLFPIWAGMRDIVKLALIGVGAPDAEQCIQSVEKFLCITLMASPCSNDCMSRKVCGNPCSALADCGLQNVNLRAEEKI